jgi:import receptor subunit TOM20
MGEGLAATGPVNEVSAALCFYRALRVYPSPVELIMSEYCLTYVVGVVFQLVLATIY